MRESKQIASEKRFNIRASDDLRQRLLQSFAVLLRSLDRCLCQNQDFYRFYFAVSRHPGRIAADAVAGTYGRRAANRLFAFSPGSGSGWRTAMDIRRPDLRDEPFPGHWCSGRTAPASIRIGA